MAKRRKGDNASDDRFARIGEQVAAALVLGDFNEARRLIDRLPLEPRTRRQLQRAGLVSVAPLLQQDYLFAMIGWQLSLDTLRRVHRALADCGVDCPQLLPPDLS